MKDYLFDLMTFKINVEEKHGKYCCCSNWPRVVWSFNNFHCLLSENINSNSALSFSMLQTHSISKDILIEYPVSAEHFPHKCFSYMARLS